MVALISGICRKLGGKVSRAKIIRNSFKFLWSWVLKEEMEWKMHLLTG